ncbi:MAG: PadR family transcriptional regulator [Rhodovibrionaceae bacterium]
MQTKTLCLAVLSQADASGYEIKKALEEAPFNHFQETSFGSIYPALAKLAEDGLVDFHEEAQDKRPDKKVYTITEAGRAALTEDLKQPPDPDRYRSDFLFVLFLGELLPREHLLKVVDDRIAWYEEKLEAMAECSAALAESPANKRFVHGFGVTVYSACLDYLRSHRHMLADEAQQTLVAE